MLTKRIIPCLDVRNGRVVKGKKFKDIVDVDDPATLGKFYSDSGADELVFYDITASNEERKTSLEFVKRVAEEINIPFCVGGGVSTIDDFTNILLKGADKVSVNSSAVKNPQLIREASEKFGAQCVVLSMDAKKNDEGSWSVYVKGGREKTDLDAIEWAKKGVELGAGEIELLSKITFAVNVPVIASGGAGNMDDFVKAAKEADADGILAASVFHFGEIKIKDLKEYMKKQGVEVRI